MIRVTRYQPIQELVDDKQAVSGVFLVTFAAQMTAEQIAEIREFSDFELTPVRHTEDAEK